MRPIYVCPCFKEWIVLSKGILSDVNTWKSNSIERWPRCVVVTVFLLPGKTVTKWEGCYTEYMAFGEKTQMCQWIVLKQRHIVWYHQGIIGESKSKERCVMATVFCTQTQSVSCQWTKRNADIFFGGQIIRFLRITTKGSFCLWRKMKNIKCMLHCILKWPSLNHQLGWGQNLRQVLGKGRTTRETDLTSLHKSGLRLG